MKINDNLEVVGTTNFPTERIDISPTDLENKIRDVYGNEVDLKHLIDIHK